MALLLNPCQLHSPNASSLHPSRAVAECAVWRSLQPSSDSANSSLFSCRLITSRLEVDRELASLRA